MSYIEFEGVEATVRIPNSADSWQLYSGMKGVGRAAQRLTSALKKALKARSRAKAVEIMSAALTKEADFGARDTEPRGVAENCLSLGRGGDYSWSL